MATQLDPPAASRQENRNLGLGPQATQLADRARTAIREQRFSDAESMLAGAAALAPTHPEILRLRGVLAHMQKQYVDSARLLRRAVELKSDDALIHNNLGSALGAGGDIEGALTAFRRACELAPQLPVVWFNLGSVLAGQGRSLEAEAALARAIEIEPTRLLALVAHAHVLRSLGRTKAAAAEYRRALTIQPDYLQALIGLADLKTVALSDAEIDTLERIYMRRDLNDDDRVGNGFALMQAFESRGRYREAFSVAASANASRRRQLTWDAQSFTRYIDSIATAFVAPMRGSADSRQGHEVIFIVSMPRSGSTLVEQILAAHPQIEGASELDVLPDIINTESRRRALPFPRWVQSASPSDWDRMGKTYLELTSQWRRARPRFTDKALSNWECAGAIRAMLPGARIVNCRRDPLETCFSCFRQNFVQGQAYTYDIDELAAFWRDYDRLSRIWQTRIADSFHSFVYEELLADPETEIRRLLDFCGLPFDEACLRSHEIERNALTASATQVREPLRRDTARAALYGDLLSPLRRALGTG